MPGDLGELTTALGADITELKRAADRAERMIKDYGRTTDRGLDKAEARWRRYGKRVKGSMSSLKSTIFSLQGAFMGLGVGLVARKAISEFATLDKGLIGVQKTTNATDVELQKIRQDIGEIALEVPVATESLLNIAQAAGQLGIQGVDNIRVFTKTIAQLETASDLVGDAGATQLARLINVTGGAIKDVDRLGSVIVALGNNMAATESEITKMATGIGQSTSVFSVTAEEATAIGAAMRSMGIQAELGGSTVGRAMRSIDASIREGGKSFTYLQKITGMTGDQLRDTFKKDATKVFQSWVEGIGRMVRGGQSASAILERFNLSGEEVLKVLPALATKSDILAKALRLQAEEMENPIALMKESAKAATSFSAQMKLTGNAINQILAGIGEGLAPAIMDAALNMRKWIKENDEFIKEDLPTYIDNIASSLGWVIERMKDAAEGAKIAGKWLGKMAYGPNTFEGMEQEKLKDLKERARITRSMIETLKKSVTSPLRFLDPNTVEKIEAKTDELIKINRQIRITRQSISDLNKENAKGEGVAVKTPSDGNKGTVAGGGATTGGDAGKPAYWSSAELAMASGKNITEALANAPWNEVKENAVDNLDTIEEEAVMAFDSIADKSERAVDRMKGAFDGWANSYARTLNDQLWASKLTFDGILESFGRMITEMMIQSAMMDFSSAMMGGGSGQGGGLLGKLLQFGVGMLGSGGGGSMGAASDFSLSGGSTATQGFSQSGSFSLGGGFDTGGWLREPVMGVGQRSGSFYALAEKGPEFVANPRKGQVGGQGGGKNITINTVVQAPEGRISKESQRQQRRSMSKFLEVYS